MQSVLNIKTGASEAIPFLIAAASNFFDKNILVILPDDESAKLLYQDLDSYLKVLKKDFYLKNMFRPIFEEQPGFKQVAAPNHETLYYPKWDVDFYSELSPERSIIQDRAGVLYKIFSAFRPFILITSLEALLYKTIPFDVYSKLIDFVINKSSLDLDKFIKNLVASGYEHDEVVEEPGTFTKRGGILDIFSPQYQYPARIEFFGDEVESLRLFDPITQKSKTELEEYIIAPARELILNQQTIQRAKQNLKLQADKINFNKVKREKIISTINNGLYFHGIEGLIPAFYDNLASLFDYIKKTKFLIINPFPAELGSKTDALYATLENKYFTALHNSRLIYSQEEMFVTKESLHEIMNNESMLAFNGFLPNFSNNAEIKTIEIKAQQLSTFSETLNLKKGNDLSVVTPIKQKIKSLHRNRSRVFFFSGNKIQAERIKDVLSDDELKIELDYHTFEEKYKTEQPKDTEEPSFNRIAITQGHINKGFVLPLYNLSFISTKDIFSNIGTIKKSSSRKTKDAFSKLLGHIKPGDILVHVYHGIGRYEGLVKLSITGTENDFLLLTYKDGDKLYLPVDRMNLLERYIATETGSPPLDKLGSKSWEAKKAKAKKAIETIAAEIIRLYAERSMAKGFAFGARDNIFKEFESSFPFDETQDQMDAIDDVLADMASIKPMDRLVCGDVGFGKTEVAIRAAFRATLDNKQTAFLVPTTILAHQHYTTFKDRFKNYPMTVQVISRVKSLKEQKEILKQLEEGKIDILIGTHRLLSKDISFKKLGLLVIDEEHRFGVLHKEKLKQIKTNVDVLTLTATPIPRTLQMAMMGLRDVSIINTPPVDRLSIKTQIARFSEDVIREAIIKELKRGGQVYFLHNRVENIETIKGFLNRVVPEGLVTIIHGQMDEELVEKRMISFINKEFDILLCTTIIESGIDIPNVNTIIINRADKFGLSQLYQIRGRVGRSKRKAYAYFLVPENQIISVDAQKRLQVLEDMTKLGAGYEVATHDLEIRGGGNVLGISQSGHIASIGLEMYLKFLEDEMKKLKGEQLEEEIEPEIKFSIPAYLPESYIPEQNQRMIIYQKFAACYSEEELEETAVEVRDRFGFYPEPVENFIEIMRIKQIARVMKIKGVEISGMINSINLCDLSLVDPDKLIPIITKKHSKIRLTPDKKLIVESENPSPDTIFKDLRNALRAIRS